MAIPLSTALATARTWLNDDAQTNWTDAALIPKAQEAHRELQVMLWNVGSPAVRKQSNPLMVSTAQTDLGANQPPDMLTPFKLVEFASVGEDISNSTEMTESIFLPNIPLGVKLGFWAWKEERIIFIGANADRKVVVYYRKTIPIPVLTTDPIGILFGELYIGARTAAIALGSQASKDAYGILSAVAKENFQEVVKSHRGQQTPPLKP